MEHRRNWRKADEYYVKKKHVKLEDLKAAAAEFNEENSKKKEEDRVEMIMEYIFKNVPEYPRPEFHVSYLHHNTNEDGLRGIKTDGGFKDPGRHGGTDLLQWWSLAVKPEDITSAERRLLEKKYPDQTQDQVQAQRSFLGEFASSPAFLKTSMFGPYRFTFSVEEVLNAYSQQFCSGAPPVMRVYKTVLYKQEVMHVVLVHSPDVRKYDDYPLLSEDDPEAVCCYRDGHFIWRSQAMCWEHRYRLVEGPDGNQMTYQELDSPQDYVWDNVTLALHVEKDQLLKFPDDKLGKNLAYCHQEKLKLWKIRPFDTFEKAKGVVEELWPEFPLQEQR